jgi:hypothetical protein
MAGKFSAADTKPKPLAFAMETSLLTLPIFRQMSSSFGNSAATISFRMKETLPCKTSVLIPDLRKADRPWEWTVLTPIRRLSSKLKFNSCCISTAIDLLKACMDTVPLRYGSILIRVDVLPLPERALMTRLSDDCAAASRMFCCSMVSWTMISFLLLQ